MTAIHPSHITLNVNMYLLMLLKLQLDGRLDAVAGVLVGLFERQLHQMLVVRPGQVTTGEDDHIGQDLTHTNTKIKKHYDDVIIMLGVLCTFNFPTICLLYTYITAS